MNKDWKSTTRLVLGPVATGSSYYPRQDIIENIWVKIESNAHVLIAAPRRVGKTSVMKAMLLEERDGFSIAFESIQNIKSEKEFYKRIYDLIFGSLSKKEKLQEWLKNLSKTISIKGIDVKGKVELEKVEIDYLSAITSIAEKIAEHNETVVLLIDELPEVLFTLYKAGQVEEAKSILKTLRVWRQEDAFKKLKFVFAGSVGIHFVVKHIEDRTSDLNDLAKVNYEPLSKVEAKNYIDWATENATIQYDETLKEIILEKINYYVPYFINLLLDRIDKQARAKENPHIRSADIDFAFDFVVKDTEYFKDWFNRLNDYLPATDFDFVNEVLIHTAHKNTISIQEIYDKAVKHKKTTEYMLLINELENDGYIVENKNGYVFISPFLQAFWKKINPIYND